MTWRAEDQEGNEAGKIRFEVVPYTRGKVLDLGCGIWRQFPHWISVDQGECMTLEGVAIKPDLVADCANLDMIEDASVDAIFSSHLLEHIEDTGAALADWWRCIKVGGYLVLYLPHADLYPRMGEPGSNPDHKIDMDNDMVIEFMKLIGSWDLKVNEVRDQGNEYSFLQVYEKL